MLNKDIDILAITKEKLVHVRVNPSSRKLKAVSEYGWSYDTLDIVLAKVKNEVGGKARMLVSDDLSYIVRMEIAGDVEKKNERSYIKENLAAHIPEKLKDKEWDFKELRFGIGGKKDKQDKKEVVVFALVSRLFKSLGDAVEKTGLNIEAIEPETIAKTRDSNPLIGLALKEDIAGKDEEVLNLTPAKVDEQAAQGSDEEVEKLKEEVEEEKEEIEELEKVNIRLKVFLIIVALSFLVTLGFFGYRYYFSGTEKDIVEKNEVPEEQVIEESATETPVPTEKQETQISFELSELVVLIQNGSGVAGEADFVEEILVSEGFEEIDTENADNFEYTETVVSLSAEIGDEVYETIERALNSDYILVRGEDLADDSDFDVLVIIGERR